MLPDQTADGTEEWFRWHAHESHKLSNPDLERIGDVRERLGEPQPATAPESG